MVCYRAEGCAAFTFNPMTERCLLKTSDSGYRPYDGVASARMSCLISK